LHGAKIQKGSEKWKVKNKKNIIKAKNMTECVSFSPFTFHFSLYLATFA